MTPVQPPPADEDAAPSRLPIIVALGTTQTIAWGSSYYLLAILAQPIARDIGVGTTTIFAAFTAALLVAALVGPRVGLTIDRFGGREVLALSNLVFAAGLGLLALAHSAPVVWAAWLVIGLGMGVGLYDSAFAALGRIYGVNARPSITGITLIAGFASTIGWPVTAYLEEVAGWRGACWAWALVHLLVGLPLNLLFLPKARAASLEATPSAGKPNIPMDWSMGLLAFAFAAGWTVSTAMAAHLPRLLEAAGATSAEAIFASALVGPAQVAARIAEARLLGRHHPLLSARLALAAHPVGAGLLLAGGGVLVTPFVLLHGAGNGILTIARGTVPLALYGPRDYGYRLGLLGAPSRIAQAFAPLAFGVLLEAGPVAALLVSTGLCLSALTALLLVRPAPRS